MNNRQKSDLTIDPTARILGIRTNELKLLVEQNQQIEGCYKDEGQRQRFTPEAIRELQMIITEQSDKRFQQGPTPDWGFFGVLIGITYAFFSAFLESAFEFARQYGTSAEYLLIIFYFLGTVASALWLRHKWPQSYYPQEKKQDDK